MQFALTGRIEINLLQTYDIGVEIPEQLSDTLGIAPAIGADAPMDVIGNNREQDRPACQPSPAAERRRNAPLRIPSIEHHAHKGEETSQARQQRKPADGRILQHFFKLIFQKNQDKDARRHADQRRQ
jgi:hypothetical protein